MPDEVTAPYVPGVYPGARLGGNLPLYIETRYEWMGFDPGMDYTSADGEVGRGALRLIQNLLAVKPGALMYPGAPYETSFIGRLVEVYDFIRYRHEPDLLISSALDCWIYAGNNGGLIQLCSTIQTAGADTILGTLHANTAHDISVIQFGKRAISTSRDNLPVVWYGTGALETLGTPPPDPNFGAAVTPVYNTPHVPGSGILPGQLDSSLGSKYYWTFSFEDMFGNETNPNDTLGSIVDPQPTVPFQAEVAIPVNSLPAGLVAANVRYVDIWRIGGTSSLLRLSRRIHYPAGLTSSGGIITDPGTGITIQDNVPDSALPDVFPSYSNLPPPLGLLTIKEHDSRLFGAGTSSVQSVMEGLGSSARLWFSRPDKPESWGIDDNESGAQGDDGGFIDIDDNGADPILTLESVGGVLVVGRRQSIYTMFGNSVTNFRFDKRHDRGVASRRAMTRRGNSVVWLGSDYKVYELGEGDPVRIGQPIEKYVLEAGVDITKSVLFYHDLKLHVCLPKLTGFGAHTLVLCDQTGAWCEVEKFDVNSAKSVNQPLGATPQAMTAPRGLTGLYQEYYYTPENLLDSVAEYTFTLKTDRIRCSRDAKRKGRLYAIYVDASFVGTLTVTINMDNGTTESYDISQSRITFVPGLIRTKILEGLPPWLEGRWFEVVITGTITVMEMRRLEIVTYPTRSVIV